MRFLLRASLSAYCASGCTSSACTHRFHNTRPAAISRVLRSAWRCAAVLAGLKLFGIRAPYHAAKFLARAAQPRRQSRRNWHRAFRHPSTM